ncbi:MAG TPA: hypothetical protein VKB14_10170 [Actinomycetales bacterium]|nr:hypothetical protein [Actinomycetales bacterium]
MQETLGEHQGSVVTRERLRDRARHTTGTDDTSLYGRLQALEEPDHRRRRGAVVMPVSRGG